MRTCFRGYSVANVRSRPCRARDDEPLEREFTSPPQCACVFIDARSRALLCTLRIIMGCVQRRHSRWRLDFIALAETWPARLLTFFCRGTRLHRMHWGAEGHNRRCASHAILRHIGGGGVVSDQLRTSERARQQRKTRRARVRLLTS